MSDDYQDIRFEQEGYHPPPMDEAALRAALRQAADERGGLAPGEIITAVPSGEPGPPGWTSEGSIVPTGYNQSFDVYTVREGPPSDSSRTPSSVEEIVFDEPLVVTPRPPGEREGTPGTDAANDIEDNFSEGHDPDGVCESCIARGFIRGFVYGAAISFVLSFLSGALLAIAVTALVALMIKGIIDLARNWGNMTDAEKQEVAAEIVGGFIGGGVGGRLSLRFRRGGGGRGGRQRGTRTKNRLPEGRRGDLGPRNGTIVKRNPQTGKVQQIRQYDQNGQPIKDIDYGHDHGAGDPHVHDWTRGSPRQPNPSRGPGRTPRPREVQEVEAIPRTGSN